MDLQKTVSAILKRDVSIEEAKEFASNQFGVLSAYLRKMERDAIIAELTAKGKRKNS